MTAVTPRNVPGSHTSSSAHTTHVRAVSEPSESGTVPLSWLTYRFSPLQQPHSRRTGTNARMALAVATISSHQASQRAERLWNGSVEVVVVQRQRPDAVDTVPSHVEAGFSAATASSDYRTPISQTSIQQRLRQCCQRADRRRDRARQAVLRQAQAHAATVTGTEWWTRDASSSHTSHMTQCL